MKHYISLVLIFILLSISKAGSAQTYEAGLFLGGSTYIGDLNPYDTPANLMRNPGHAFGGFVRYNHTQHLSLRLNINHGAVSGVPEDSPYELPDDRPDVSFSTNITEMSLYGEVNFLPYSAGDPDSPYTTYIFGGTGGFLFKQPVTEDYKMRRLSYVAGAGFKFFLTRQLSGGIHWGMRSTTTDQLDGIYEDSGNPKVNDWYSFAGFSLALRFRDRKSAVCPY